jgi:hypothetical protein
MKTGDLVSNFSVFIDFLDLQKTGAKDMRCASMGEGAKAKGMAVVSWGRC